MNDIKKVNQLLHRMFIISVVILPYGADYFYYPKVFILYAFILGILGILVVTQNPLPINYPMARRLIIYLLIIYLTNFFSIDPLQSIWGKSGRQEGLITLTFYVLLYLIGKKYYRYDKAYLNFIYFPAYFISMYGIIQYIGFDPISRDAVRFGWKNRAFSTIGNPNFLGTYLILLLPLFIFFYFKKAKTKDLIAASLLYVCMLVTFTRSAQMGFMVIAIGFFILALKHAKYRKNALILLGIFILLTGAVEFQSQGRLTDRFFSIAREANDLVDQKDAYEEGGAGRVYIWMKTIELVKNRPLTGYGLENMQQVFIKENEEDMQDRFGRIYYADRAHNEYLHIAVSSGIPSLLAYIAFLLSCLQMGYTFLKQDVRYFPYLIAVIAYLVQAFFNISVVSVAYMFWIFLGIISSGHVFEQKTKDKTIGNEP